MLITQPCDTVRQLSGFDTENRRILSVLAKRTYEIGEDGRCRPADDQAPLVLDPVDREDNPRILKDDSDLYPTKLATDVVILGAEAHAPVPVRRLEVSVTVGRVRRRIQVAGDRHCYRTHAGRIAFSKPKPFDTMPLGYDRAYGGQDVLEAERLGNPLEPLKAFLPAEWDLGDAGPCLYPRNPAGVGYVVALSPKTLETVRLPNVEDPEDRLTPERLVAGKPEHWPHMPLPAGFDWYGYAWFPRLAYFGIVPEFDTGGQEIMEVSRSWAPANVLAPPGPSDPVFPFRFAGGAHPGLQFPFLEGNETIILEHLDRRVRRFRFQLPGERPRIWTDGRKGKLNPTTPVIHTVRIDPAARRISLVWRGSAPAIREYFPQELETMPLKVEW